MHRSAFSPPIDIGQKRSEPRPLPRLALNLASRGLYGLWTRKNMGPLATGTVIEPAVPVPLVTGFQSSFGPVRAGLEYRVPTPVGVHLMVMLPLTGWLTLVMVTVGVCAVVAAR